MRLTTQHTADQELLVGVQTALALLKTACEHRAVADSENREKVLASKAAVDAEFVNYGKMCKLRLVEFRSLLTARKHVLVTLMLRAFSCLPPRRTLKRPLQLRSGDSQRSKT